MAKINKIVLIVAVLISFSTIILSSIYETNMMHRRNLATWESTPVDERPGPDHIVMGGCFSNEYRVGFLYVQTVAVNSNCEQMPYTLYAYVWALEVPLIELLLYSTGLYFVLLYFSKKMKLFVQ